MTFMGIDRSLADDFPTVEIDGELYHYGREPFYGQYLVENHDYAKDYWVFDTRDDLIAFLVNLPESTLGPKADYPNWADVTHEERRRMMVQHRAKLRRMANKMIRAGTANRFVVDGQFVP